MVIPPKFLNDPNYNPDRFPRAFEDALLMVLKDGDLYAIRNNIEDPYEVDHEIKKRDTDETVFFVEAEYDASGKVFSENGEIQYKHLNVPTRKAKYFKKEKPTFYVKGNLQYVFALNGDYVLKFGKEKEIPCEFRRYHKPSFIRTVVLDNLLQIETKHALESGNLLFGPINQWVEFCKKLLILGEKHEGASFVR